MDPLRFLIFTDLDGTLLDHETYDYTPALPMLARLRAMGAVVVLASSKTGAEIAEWQDRLGLVDCPAIVENGAALYDGSFDDRDYRRIRAVLRALNAPFLGFGDMDDAGVAAVTGLSPGAARKARTRAHSEPGLWQGTDAQLDGFLSALAEHGIQARRGGRFLTLSFGGTKAAQMEALIDRYAPEVTVALGDAPNDAEMLARADYGIVVRNDHGPGLPSLPGEDAAGENGPGKEMGRILRTRAEGPAGWTEGMATLLARPELSGAADG